MVQETEKESLGAYLRRERGVRNISLDEISATTKINQTLLTFLEEDRHENLPNPIFVKGYLKAYASHVGLDPKDVITRFNERNQLNEKKSLHLVPTPIENKKIDYTKSFPKRLYWLLFGLITIGIAVLASTLSNKHQGAIDTTATLSTETVAKAIQPEVIATTEERKPTKEELKPSLTSPIAQALQIQTIKPVWLKIQIDNHPTYSQRLVSNKEIQLKGEKEIKIYISDRSAVKLTHNGNLLDYSGNEPLPLFLELNQN